MNDSVFDPEKFMNSVTEDAGSTSLTPIPTGEYTAVVDDVEWREAKTKAGEARMIMRVIWRITDNDLANQLDRVPTVRQDVWLDVDKRTGGLDFAKGKNIGVGRLREALGQNNPGQRWAPGMLKGAGPALLTITQRGDKENTDTIYNDVKSVGKITY